jgi:hypothetical protein
MSGASLRAFVVIQEGGMMGGMNIFTVRLEIQIAFLDQNITS